MNSPWKNTRKALKDFINVLTCNKCGNKPESAMTYTNCGHFFCKQCVGNDSVCIKCNTPVQPIEICNDHMIESLTSYCSSIAEIIQEKDVWITNSDALNATFISTVSLNLGSKANSKKQHFIPKRNINKQNAKGETLLHTACAKNQEDYVRTLLAAGANPNTKDNADWTPLQEAVNYGFTNICQLLLECGASPNVPGRENRTALHDAAMNNRVAEAKLLLKYSAKRDVYDNQGRKPIDYSKPFKEMWDILKEENDLNGTSEKIVHLNCTLDQSLLITQSPFVIFASNLKEDNKKCLNQMALKHKIKITSAFRSSVTHVIVEANSQNVTKLSYDVMMAFLRGNWILNSEWIHLAMDLDDLLTMDLELFEISGAPVEGIPKKARENAQNQNPRLFDQCHFYFALQPKETYYISEVQLTVESLIRLVNEGSGTVLSREPNPEDIKREEQTIPFHIANQPSHPLYKCTYYIIYVPGRDEPRVKYNMPHIKTLPLMWLIECIEKFTLINPSYLGLL